MKITHPLPLLGGLSPVVFMRDYWQKKPLLVRGAISLPSLSTLPSKQDLFALSNREEVQSRLVQFKKNQWQLTHNPATLPAVKTPHWSLLVQGVDLLHSSVHELLQQFRFVPDSRLDDAMFSFATKDGGVGPHFDSYDVFLIQTSGRKRWRIGKQKNLTLIEGAPLKILADFKPSKEYVLEAGDLLYLPPRYAHDGVALEGDDCITCSIGFRAPKKVELGRELMERLAEDVADRIDEAVLYTDKEQSATAMPGYIPTSLLAFAQEALQSALGHPNDLQIHLGEYLTEPKPEVWFEGSRKKIAWSSIQTITLDRASRMMFDDKHIFINGESFAASGQDAKLMRQLSNERRLLATDIAKASQAARELLADWITAGWCHA